MIENIEDFILIEGVDDWVPILAIDGHAKKLGFQESGIRHERVITAIERLLVKKLVTVGDLRSEGKFLAWKGTLADVTSQVKSFPFTAPDHEWGLNLWTSNTEAGDRAGRAAAKKLR